MAYIFQQLWVRRGKYRDPIVWAAERSIWQSLIKVALSGSGSVKEGVEEVLLGLNELNLESSASKWYDVEGEPITI
jgi:hypothetical protein